MKTKYLFPIVFRKIGWSLFIPAFIYGIALLIYYICECDSEFLSLGSSNTIAIIGGELFKTEYFCITENDWTEEVIIVFLTISMLFIGFSKEKDEDECIANIRMNALTWATITNSIFMTIGSMLIFGVSYLYFMFVCMFSFLLLFIIKYTWDIYRFRKN